LSAWLTHSVPTCLGSAGTGDSRPSTCPTRSSHRGEVHAERWLWTSVVVLLMGVFSLVRLKVILTADVKTDAGTVPGLNSDALWQSASYAFPTLAVWSLLFLAVDRWKPQRWLLWALALFWGGSVAAYGAIVVNSWAAEHLSIDQNGNQLAGARAAIYVAPFVEEFFKATVVFLVAFLDRRRLTSKLSLVSLAGLSAIGFAFSENIVYFARAIVYGSMTGQYGRRRCKAVAQLVQMRGLWTSFGHPLFTSMTAMGLAIGLRSRAKVVRVLAPIAGYLTAALLHMTFNTVASLFPDSYQKMIYFTIALPLLAAVALYAVFQVVREGRLIRNRLSDYVMAGWVPDTYPHLFSKVSSGPGCWRCRRGGATSSPRTGCSARSPSWRTCVTRSRAAPSTRRACGANASCCTRSATTRRPARSTTPGG
jgi:RsiW-degrading membrane proteinase PrsW (M82 family)